MEAPKMAERNKDLCDTVAKWNRKNVELISLVSYEYNLVVFHPQVHWHRHWITAHLCEAENDV